LGVYALFVIIIDLLTYEIDDGIVLSLVKVAIEDLKIYFVADVLGEFHQSGGLWSRSLNAF